MKASDLAKATDALIVKKGEWILGYSSDGTRELLIINDMPGCDAQVRRGRGYSLKKVLKSMDEAIRGFESIPEADLEEMRFEMEKAYNALHLEREIQLQIARGLMRESRNRVSHLQLRIERTTGRELKHELRLDLERVETELARLTKRENKLRR